MPLLREPGAPAPYQQIREILREEVMENMSPGDRIGAERELAKRFGANRATISRAIASLVNEGLLVRRVGRGTFVANGEDKVQRTKTRTVGLILPFIHGAFPAGIVKAAVHGLRERGYKAVLFDSEDQVPVEADELERFTQESLDGALIMPIERSDNLPTFGRLLRIGPPLVFMDRKPVGLGADLVATDNRWGAYQAVSRLIERGHRRIAHFTWLTERDCTSIQERRLGYQEALRDHGIEADPELIQPPVAHPNEDLYFKYSLAYLRQGPDPVTAVFCLHDQFVLSTVAAAVALGLRVPDDVEIAGFYDSSFRPIDDVPVIKVVQRQEEIGHLAAELLASRVDGKGPEGPQTALVKPDLVENPVESLI